MINTRVIARLDIKGPNVIKGIQFDGLRVLGPVEWFAKLYSDSGADEIIIQDSVASLYKRSIGFDVIKKAAREIQVPVTVAGGIRSTEDIRELLRAGADKVAINTAGVSNPNLFKDAVKMFGSQCIVASLEVYRHKDNRLEIWTDYGRELTGIDASEWLKKVVELGVGEILLTSINREGTGKGFDLDLIRKFTAAVPIPVVACGGAGSAQDFVKAATEAKADAIAAASIFHYHYADAKLPDNFVQGRYKVRALDETDTGNVDFLHDGYGGRRDLMVTPTSLGQVKTEMKKAGLHVRP